MTFGEWIAFISVTAICGFLTGLKISRSEREKRERLEREGRADFRLR